MRPHQLTMQAFGPFASTEVVDFDSSDDFILITGPTGSGKTTIFDALTFSLYGEFPGTRDGSGAVSNLAEKDASPCVQLEFSVRGRKYLVKRIPQHLRPAKKGSGLVESPQSVEFYELKDDRWHPVPGTLKTVNSKIQEILHLSPDEFQKIVLLPQGEFQKFLVSETRDREALLAKIFPVKDHESVSQYVKDLRNEKKALLSTERRALDDVLAIFNPAEYEDKQKAQVEKNEELKAEYRRLRDDLDLFVKRIADDEHLENEFAELDSLNVELNKLVFSENEIVKLDQEKEKAKKLLILKPQIVAFRDTQVALEKRERDITGYRVKLDAERKRYSSIKTEAEKIPSLEKENEEAHAIVSRLESLLPREKDLILRKKEYLTCLEEKNFFQEKLEAEEKILTLSEKDITVLKKTISERENLSLKNDSIIENLAKVSLAFDKMLDSERKNKELDQLKKSRLAFISSLKDAETSLAINQETEKDYIGKKEEAMASGLASVLVDGQPCPVCGSREHPEPAFKKTEPFTEEDKLKAISLNIRNSEKEIATLKEKIKSSENRIEQLVHEIESLGLDQELTLSFLSDEKKRLEVEKKKSDQNRDALVSEKKTLNEKEKTAQESRKRYDSLLKKTSEKNLQFASIEKEKALLEEELRGYENISEEIGKTLKTIEKRKEYIADVTFRLQKSLQSGEGLSERMNMAKEEFEKLKDTSLSAEKRLLKDISSLGFSDIYETEKNMMSDDEIKKTEIRIKEFYDKKTGVESRLSSVIKKTEDKKRPDIESLQKEKEKKVKLCDEKEKEKSENEKGLSELQGMKKKYDKIISEIESMNAEFNLLDRLANDLNGQNPKMINFQNFILNAYLREVTGYATQRFNVMSEGRYSLVVNEEVFHGRKQTGLELDVYDSFSGQKRSVRTLSGGEKFLASISLALGLSDVIQSRAGMVDLDSIFIDEGFGSLDESALDRALTILDTIKGDRLVGIISHVSELRNRIPSQIQVKKGTRGSYIEQNY